MPSGRLDLWRVCEHSCLQWRHLSSNRNYKRYAKEFLCRIVPGLGIRDVSPLKFGISFSNPIILVECHCRSVTIDQHSQPRQDSWNIWNSIWDAHGKDDRDNRLLVRGPRFAGRREGMRHLIQRNHGVCYNSPRQQCTTLGHHRSTCRVGTCFNTHHASEGDGLPQALCRRRETCGRVPWTHVSERDVLLSSCDRRQSYRCQPCKCNESSNSKQQYDSSYRNVPHGHNFVVVSPPCFRSTAHRSWARGMPPLVGRGSHVCTSCYNKQRVMKLPETCASRLHVCKCHYIVLDPGQQGDCAIWYISCCMYCLCWGIVRQDKEDSSLLFMHSVLNGGKCMCFHTYSPAS
jgi:hypothetical protein